VDFFPARANLDVDDPVPIDVNDFRDALQRCVADPEAESPSLHFLH